jgi:RimJ/RimL family protein N-acetyltransferase
MIETLRLRLRGWREEDVAPFIHHTNTPTVMRWLGGVMPPDQLEAVVRDRLMRWQDERGFTFWAVERIADDELLGFCGLKLADSPGSTIGGWHEIGWRLREDAWGQGYAREAAEASLGHAFTALAAPRVAAITVAGNRASWTLMERLGMTRRPDLDYDDPR